VGHLIVGGVRHDCAATTVDWFATALGFSDLPMREAADQLVLGWTGTDELAAAHYKNMRSRVDRKTHLPLNQSAHVFIDHKGLVTQWCDVLARAQFSGRANKRGVLVELSNRADATRNVRGIVRERVLETVNGETADQTTLTAPQMRAAIQVVETLCAALAIPFAVPMDGNNVVSCVVPEQYLAAYKGVLCRLHLDQRRSDAGLAILRSLAAKSIRGRAEQQDQ
jgi:hypothetical protein